MQSRPPRYCQEVISNEGTSERSRGEHGTYVARECGLEAETYCSDCARYLCVIHAGSRHDNHNTANR